VTSRHPIAAIMSVALLCACASPRERLYTLIGSEPTPAEAPSPALHVAVGPVTIPDAVDRPQLVVRESPTRLRALEQERWAEPLREAVPRILAESIGTQLRSAKVTAMPSAAAADLRVSFDLARFEALPGDVVIVEAHWQVRAKAGTIVAEGTSVARLPVHEGPQDYDSLVAAESAALKQIGTEVAGAIERNST